MKETIQKLINTDLGEKVLVIAKTRTIWEEGGKTREGLACTDKVLTQAVVDKLERESRKDANENGD